jgi:hypothetical protein
VLALPGLAGEKQEEDTSGVRCAKCGERELLLVVYFRVRVKLHPSLFVIITQKQHQPHDHQTNTMLHWSSIRLDAEW